MSYDSSTSSLTRISLITSLSVNYGHSNPVSEYFYQMQNKAEPGEGGGDCPECAVSPPGAGGGPLKVSPALSLLLQVSPPQEFLVWYSVNSPVKRIIELMRLSESKHKHVCAGSRSW